MSSDDPEILRLRDWKHQAESTQLAHGWRLDALDEWRRGVDRELAGCRKDLDGVMTADEMANAVAERLHERSRSTWTKREKLAGLALALLAVLSPHLGGWHF